MISRDASPIIAPCLANQRGSSLKQHLGGLGSLALATLAIATSLSWLILRQTDHHRSPKQNVCSIGPPLDWLPAMTI